MKYLYKQTGTIVESGITLDSIIFSPYEEQKETAEKEEKPVRKPTTRQRTKKAAE